MRRREFLIGSAAAVAAASGAAKAAPQPRITVSSQWAAGNDGKAMDALGKLFTDAGGAWKHNPVPGGTSGLMNKIRAEMIAKAAPAASQLKGPEIAAWSKTYPTVDLNGIVAGAGFEALMPKEIVDLHKPFGNWIAIPAQVFRTNTLFLSKKAMEKVGENTIPKTWDDFNSLASKMQAKGIATPLAAGGLAWDHGQKFEFALSGISIESYRAAIMRLEDDALKGCDVLDAFKQLRRLANFWDPGAAGQHYSVLMPRFMSGDMGIIMHGGMAEGVAKFSGFSPDDYLVGNTPQNSGPPAFDLNADSFIFWQQKDEDLQEGQKLLAKTVMSPAFGPAFSGITGSIPVRSDVDMKSAAFTDNQREAARAFSEAIKNKTVILSLGQNMAQTAQITSAMLDVLAEFVSDKGMTAEAGQKKLVSAVADNR
ncbi:carbohydrate ABC transporter substrate-binding protein [Bosea caraganae]|uniref:Carbohydrate ABC transporter substrate-binding protein n=2 Tax=Bosea caraganae TaxID=2763117 RepID=A0A370L3M5_9HYPH|nr:carbohydrate ABC transporter substrate-binding protein [Bosea caraganae]RDJ22816.1 carbohydrate ABC transporter substrate-binding protein [Bosea caraganae]